LLFFIIKISRIIFLDHQIQVLRYILELYGILGRKIKWLKDFTHAYLEFKHSKQNLPSAASEASGRTARDDRSDRQVLYGSWSDRPYTQSDHLVRPSRSKAASRPYLLHVPSYSFICTPTKNTSPPFLSQGEKNPPYGEALPFDPGPTEGISGFTTTSSIISSGYFIDSLPLYPWISFVRV
jgi:hypothetical protein